jgi:hypothetical protein
MKTTYCFKMMNRALLGAALVVALGTMTLPPSTAATLLVAPRTSTYQPPAAIQALVALTEKHAGVARTVRNSEKVSTVVATVQKAGSQPVVTTDGKITGKCNGQIECPQCTDACVAFKFGRFIIDLVEGVNDDGCFDELIAAIEKTTWEGVNDFGCMCSGL